MKRWLHGGDRRIVYGAITSFVADDGKRLTIHRTGPIRQAVKAACDAAVKVDPSFRVVCVSTPESIYRDMDGSREVTRVQVESLTGSSGAATSRIRYPEGTITPKGMLHPSLRFGPDSDGRER